MLQGSDSCLNARGLSSQFSGAVVQQLVLCETYVSPYFKLAASFCLFAVLLKYGSFRLMAPSVPDVACDAQGTPSVQVQRYSFEQLVTSSRLVQAPRASGYKWTGRVKVTDLQKDWEQQLLQVVRIAQIDFAAANKASYLRRQNSLLAKHTQQHHTATRLNVVKYALIPVGKEVNAPIEYKVFEFLGAFAEDIRHTKALQKLIATVQELSTTQPQKYPDLFRVSDTLVRHGFLSAAEAKASNYQGMLSYAGEKLEQGWGKGKQGVLPLNDKAAVAQQVLAHQPQAQAQLQQQPQYMPAQYQQYEQHGVAQQPQQVQALYQQHLQPQGGVSQMQPTQQYQSYQQQNGGKQEQPQQQQQAQAQAQQAQGQQQYQQYPQQGTNNQFESSALYQPYQQPSVAQQPQQVQSMYQQHMQNGGGNQGQQSQQNQQGQAQYQAYSPQSGSQYATNGQYQQQGGGQYAPQGQYQQQGNGQYAGQGQYQQQQYQQGQNAQWYQQGQAQQQSYSGEQQYQQQYSQQGHMTPHQQWQQNQQWPQQGQQQYAQQDNRPQNQQWSPQGQQQYPQGQQWQGQQQGQQFQQYQQQFSPQQNAHNGNWNASEQNQQQWPQGQQYPQQMQQQNGNNGQWQGQPWPLPENQPQYQQQYQQGNNGWGAVEKPHDYNSDGHIEEAWYKLGQMSLMLEKEQRYKQQKRAAREKAAREKAERERAAQELAALREAEQQRLIAAQQQQQEEQAPQQLLQPQVAPPEQAAQHAAQQQYQQQSNTAASGGKGDSVSQGTTAPTVVPASTQGVSAPASSGAVKPQQSSAASAPARKAAKFTINKNVNLPTMTPQLRERQDYSLQLIRKLGLIVGPQLYDQYCQLMRQRQLTPFDYNYLLKLNLVRIFGVKGYLAQRLEQYEPRRGQLMFANSVLQTLNNSSFLMVEAGTGTGKTFSYLVPPLLAQRKIMVSTGSKALQDQLVSKDIPNLTRMLNLPEVHYMSLKGQQNYICRYLLEGTGFRDLKRSRFTEINSYAEQCAEDIDKNIYKATFGEINFPLYESEAQAITCDSALCYEMGRTCEFMKRKRSYLNQEASGQSQPEIDGEHCFIFAARQEAKNRHVVAINNSLFFANLRSENKSILPHPDVLIFDEAHSLPETGRKFFTREYNFTQLVELEKDVIKAFEDTSVSLHKSEISTSLLKYVRCVELIERMMQCTFQDTNVTEETARFKYLHNLKPSALQLLGYLLLLPQEEQALGADSLFVQSCKDDEARRKQQYAAPRQGKSRGGFDDGEGVAVNLLGESEDPALLPGGYLALINRLRRDSEDTSLKTAQVSNYIELLLHLSQERLQELTDNAKRQGLYTDVEPSRDIIMENIGGQNMPVADQLFRSLMVDWLMSVRALKEQLVKSQEVNEAQVGTIVDTCKDLEVFIADFMNADRNKEGVAQWENASWVTHSHKGFKLVVAPVDISPLLGQALRDIAAQGTKIIFTSATITVKQKFDKFCHDVGLSLDEVDTAVVESPFDYYHQACLMYSSTFPDTRDKDRIKKGIAKIEELIRNTPGGVFFLTTSNSALKQAAEILHQKFDRERLVLVQDRSKSDNNTLLQQFRQNGRAILVGTNSFWEGVDVPGKALSLVVIDKLPFKSDSEPLQKARKGRYASLNRNFFAQVSLPEAVITLRQGVGRLIRKESDRGAVVIMDPRLANMHYKDEFLKSLPPLRHVHTVQEVLDFFSEC